MGHGTGSSWTPIAGWARDPLIRFAGTDLSDHNRSELSVDYEKISNDVRTANGTLRRYQIAEKREFSWGWEMLPSLDTETVDGKMGGDSLLAFYTANPGSFTMQILAKDNSTRESITVMITDFSYEIVKRWDSYWYNIDITVVEV